MTRTHLILISIVFIVWIAGCAKKPLPEPIPKPMTEAYLLKHMHVVRAPDRSRLTVTPLSIRTHPRFSDANATLATTFSADITLGDAPSSSAPKAPEFLLLFSMRAAAWGKFSSIIDTSGNRFDVIPYTSYIRHGIFYENFYIPLSRPWIEAAGKDETSLLLLGPNGEISVTLPVVYPAALLHYLDAQSYMPDSNGTK